MTEPTPADEFAAAAEQAEAVLSATAGGALVPAAGANPVAVRAMYGNQAATARRAAAALKEAADRRAAELKALLEAHQAEVAALMKPLQATLQKLTEQVWTVNLYLGRDEQITMISDGELAPADTPITLRQLVLAMDEECLVSVEDGGIDGRDIDQFIGWLTADPKHLDQVLPDPKGVVVLVPSRQKRDFGDRWLTKAVDEANSVSYWLIRNGQRVYIMTTDLKVGDRLLPTRAEFEEFFWTTPRWGPDAGKRVRLEPGSDEWVQAEQKRDARGRHYMRIMLVLQGLAERSVVFAPTVEPVNFMDLASHDRGQIRVINEIDHALTQGRPSWDAFQRDLMAELQPGMRIIGAFNGTDWHSAGRYDSSTHGHSRLRPERASYPASKTIHTITAKAYGDGLVFHYQRTDTIDDYDGWGYYVGQRAPQRRAACTIHRDDRFILPIDQVTIDDLRYYLYSRTDRSQYLSMIPVIKAAIAAKEAEAAAEAPFKQLLAGRLAAAYPDLAGTDVAGVVDGLVDWWKFTNRQHRPLVCGTDDDSRAREAAAIAAIEKEYAAACRDAQRDPAADAATVAEIRASWPEVICIARRRNGTIAAYAPAADGEQVWLTIREYTRGRGKLALRDIKVWTMATGRSRAAQTVLWSTPVWDGWNHRASRSDHLTGPEMSDLAEQTRSAAAGKGTPIAVVLYDRRFICYAWKPDADLDSIPRHTYDVMVTAVGHWRRDQTGRAVIDLDWRTYEWMFDDKRYRQLWVDDTELVKVRQMQKRQEEQTAARKALYNQAVDLYQGIRERWLAEETERQHTRFLQDHGIDAEDLWPHHLGTLQIVFPDTGGLMDVLHDLVDADAITSDMTVGQVLADSKRFGTSKKIPASVADMLIAPKD